MGPGCGALAVNDALAKFLPVPIVTFDGKVYGLDYDRPESIGKVRDFHGNAQVVLRAYAWIMSMGVEGLKTVAETAVLNNNYLEKLLLAVPGISESYGDDRIRLDQVRYSWEKLAQDTDVHSEDIEFRMTDYGIQSYWLSHHPFVIPEPFTPEPSESHSKDDLEYWAAVMRQISKEAYEDPEMVKSGPHRALTPRTSEDLMWDSDLVAATYKQYIRKKQGSQ